MAVRVTVGRESFFIFTCNMQAALPEEAACIHRDRDLPTQGRAHARSRGYIAARFICPVPRPRRDGALNKVNALS